MRPHRSLQQALQVGATLRITSSDFLASACTSLNATVLALTMRSSRPPGESFVSTYRCWPAAA
jgi:hypothetical protein